MIFLFLFFLFSVLPNLLESGCLFWDPEFESNPTVQDLSPTKIRVEWNRKRIDNLDCVDHFFVHYWKTDSEARFKVKPIQKNKNTFRLQINVEDDTKYSIQINAFEDGGCCRESKDNWSNKISHRTTKGKIAVNIHFSHLTEVKYPLSDSCIIFIFLFSCRTITNIKYRTTTYNYCNTVDDNIYYRYQNNHQAISKNQQFYDNSKTL